MKVEDVRHLRIYDEVRLQHPTEGELVGKVDAFVGPLVTVKIPGMCRCPANQCLLHPANATCSLRASRVITVTCNLIEKMAPHA